MVRPCGQFQATGVSLGPNCFVVHRRDSLLPINPTFTRPTWQLMICRKELMKSTSTVSLFPSFQPKLVGCNIMVGKRELSHTSETLIHPTWKPHNNVQPKGNLFWLIWHQNLLKDPDLVFWKSFEMNWQHTYRGPSFYVGCFRGALVYDNSLSLFVIINPCEHWVCLWKNFFL